MLLTSKEAVFHGTPIWEALDYIVSTFSFSAKFCNSITRHFHSIFTLVTQPIRIFKDIGYTALCYVLWYKGKKSGDKYHTGHYYSILKLQINHIC